MAWACGRGHPGQTAASRLEEISDIVGRKSTHSAGTVLHAGVRYSLEWKDYVWPLGCEAGMWLRTARTTL
jgi:hypothetical protein